MAKARYRAQTDKNKAAAKALYRAEPEKKNAVCRAFMELTKRNGRLL